ncbi:hypothetical protein GGI22_008018, partial [Coemansia erecta]
HRHGRKATHRLFGFVDAALDNDKDCASEKDDGSGGSKVANGIAGNEHNEVGGDNEAAVGGDAVPDANVDGAEANHEAEVPDPGGIGGIYEMSQTKRRRLGLDGSETFELADSVPGSIVLDVDSCILNTEISVKGRPKPMSQITPQDESDMTLDEYAEYWNAWHQLQAGVI